MTKIVSVHRVDRGRVAQIAERHIRFWNGKTGITPGSAGSAPDAQPSASAQIAAPLRSAAVFAPSIPFALPQPDGTRLTDARRVSPEMIHPELLIDDVLARYEMQPDMTIFDSGNCLMPGIGDILPFSYPFPKIPWLEAALGLPIELNGGQIWVREADKPFQSYVENADALPSSPWLELYTRFLRALESRAADRFPVSPNTLFRGPSDLTAAILGVSESCIRWLETPATMQQLLRMGVDANKAFVNAGRQIASQAFGGYACSYGIIAPDPVIRVQADHSSLLSPEIYEEQILPFDSELLGVCPASVFHIHNNGLHIAPFLVSMEHLDVIEITVDPYPKGERKAHEISEIRKILERKPVILNVNFPSVEEARSLESQLKHPNLFLNSRFSAETLDALPPDYPGRTVWTIQ